MYIYILLLSYIYIYMLFSICDFIVKFQAFASRRHVCYTDMSPSPEEEATAQQVEFLLELQPILTF